MIDGMRVRAGNDLRDGGLSIQQWAGLYTGVTRFTENGPQRWAWPDGRSYVEQPAIAVAMFETFDWAVNERMAEDRGK